MYNPHSQYSASKVGSDLFVRVFYDIYGIPTIETNCKYLWSIPISGETYRSSSTVSVIANPFQSMARVIKCAIGCM